MNLPDNIFNIKVRLTQANISWPICLVVTASMLGNNLFNKPALLASILLFAYLNFHRLKLEISFYSFSAYGIILFEIWAALSIFWTAIPSTTINIVSVQLSLLFLAFLMSLEAHDHDLGASLKIAAYCIIAINLIYCVLFFGQAMTSIGLKGLYGQKNNFGVILAICNLILLYAGDRQKIDYYFLALGLVMFALTMSKTSMILFVAIVLSMLLFKKISTLFRQLSTYSQGFIRLTIKLVPFLFYILIIIMVIYHEQIAGYLVYHVSDELMTGRGLIWRTILARTSDHLLIGMGPGVYFESSTASEIFKTMMYFNNPMWIEKLAGADNGFVDIISSVGFIGLALLFVSFVQTYRLLFALKHHKNAPLIFALSTFFIFDNVGESTLYHSANMPWLFYLIFCFYLVQLKYLRHQAQRKTHTHYAVT